MLKVISRIGFCIKCMLNIMFTDAPFSISISTVKVLSLIVEHDRFSRGKETKGHERNSEIISVQGHSWRHVEIDAETVTI